MTKAPKPAIVQHAVLEQRGGAARVARQLFAALKDEGEHSRYSFELAETRQGAQDLVKRPWRETLVRDAEAGAILHLHGSADWGALLASLPQHTRLAITLHDVSLLTGGCPFPLDCAHFGRGCADPCPRGFPDAAARFARQVEELRRLSPLVACPSRWMKERLKATLPGMRASVAPNGVDWSATIPSQTTARASLGVAPEARVAIFVAHGGEDAGYKAGPRWADIWKSMKDRLPQALAFFVGGTEQGRDGDLLRWPYLEQEQLRLLLRAADVLVYPSLADNHPLLVLEAMSMGCAVAASAVGGIPEQIEHEHTGLLAPAGDFSTLADNAVKLLAHPSRARSMGGAAREQCRKRFRSERMIAAYRKLYAKLAA